jgi:cation transport regulator ChaB
MTTPWAMAVVVGILFSSKSNRAVDATVAEGAAKVAKKALEERYAEKSKQQQLH